MSLVGKIVDFDPAAETWQQYSERLTYYFLANGVTEEERKKATLLAAMSPKNFRLLRNLLSPETPDDKTFKEIVEILQKHHNPPPSEIVQRYRFHTRVCKPEESIATFVAELRALAEHCGFGPTLSTMLRDRLVCGVNMENVQKRLLAEEKLTFEEALRIATSLETASRNAIELQAGETNTQPAVLKVGKTEAPKVSLECYRCGKAHPPQSCKFRRATCRNCGKLGHIQRVCRSKPQAPSSETSKGYGRQPRRPTGIRTLQLEEEQESRESIDLPMNNLTESDKTKPIKVEVTVEGKKVSMELDTGAAVSIMSHEMHKSLWPEVPLESTAIKLRTYPGERIHSVGCRKVRVQCNHQSATVELVVVEGNGPCLFGRDWLQVFRLDWRRICSVKEDCLETVLTKYDKVFQEGLGRLQGYTAKLQVDPEAQPKFFKARSVPYLMKGKIEEELERLTKAQIIEPLQFSDWAAPVVPVLKPNKTVRICGDFKLTVNPVSRLDRYPIPKIEDLLSGLSQGKTFTTLDMSQAYQQLELDDNSKKYVVINTHKGLYRYNRLPFGIASAPGIFQRVMESLVQGIPGVVVYLDDILVTGKTEEEHLKSLEEVLKRLLEAGLRLRREKCVFMQDSVTYLGYRIDSQGLHPIAEKVDSIKKAPSPSNVNQLKSYLGLLSYYGRFIPNMTNTLFPLYRLLKKDVRWRWTNTEEEAFETSKRLLTSTQVLTHFDPNLELVLSCDASSYGVGAVLAHKFPDGSEKPVAYASRTLTQAEKGYSQLEKEGLACIFGIKKFRSYLYGHRFTIYTDHLPLKSLFNEQQAIPVQASGRIQRWALLLSSYEYSITFRPTHKHGNADAMSRLPVPETNENEQIPTELVLLMETLENSPVTAKDIRDWTAKDPQLSRVYNYVQSGWAEQIEPELKMFHSMRDELSTLNGCILRGSRVVVPPPGRSLVLSDFHEGHPGMSRMKSLMRLYVWWPNLDAQIEELVKSCNECQQSLF